MDEIITPTADLKFIDGVLHQRFVITNGDTSVPEWRPVPSESPAPVAQDEPAA